MGLHEAAGRGRFFDWQPEASCRAISAREFTFLNQTVAGNGSIPWNDRQHAKLWLYHLNYFDFLNAGFLLRDDKAMVNAALDMALDWRQHNMRGTEVGWEPYPLSVRIVNWLKFLTRRGRDLELLGEATKINVLLESLGQQTATLEHRLEKDILGNHLLKNIKALLFAGALLETCMSSRWWEEGEKLLEHELNEQILPDGGHFERSPMYHAQVLEDLADIQCLCALTERCLPYSDLLARKVRAMTQFLNEILHPDGAIPLFNDSVLGGMRPVSDLLAMSSMNEIERPGNTPLVTLFPNTGYGVIRNCGSESALIFDCGPLGPDYQPGHGHCDVLSYELSLHGQRVVVDTGVSTYERTAERIHERSTAAHNTVRIDGEDQAEVWASFRVGRRPQVGKLEGGTIGDRVVGRSGDRASKYESSSFYFLKGEHYAYERRGVVHARQIALQASGTWIVADLLKGRGYHRAESFIHFHPQVQVQTLGGPSEVEETAPRHRWLLEFAHQTYSLVTYGEGEFSLIESWYSEEFGKRQGSKVLRWAWEGGVPRIMVYALVPEGVPAPGIVVDTRRYTVNVDGRPILLR